MENNLPRISAVILNISGSAGLADCLRSLDACAYPGLEVIVVHNGPRREGLEAEVRAACSKPGEVLFTGFNSGFAAGNNAGIKRALARGADHVLLLNDDAVAAPDLMERLAAPAADPAAGLLGPRIFYFSEPEKIWFSGARFDRAACSFNFPGADSPAPSGAGAASEESDFITGCAVLASRALIEKIGLLDERFFLYWEDADWGLRAAAAGFKNALVPAARVWHKVSASSGGTDSPAKAYYKTRSWLLFAELHAAGARGGILLKILRDTGWLLLRSAEPDRFRKAAALLLAVLHYFSGRAGAGPRWLTGERGGL